MDQKILQQITRAAIDAAAETGCSPAVIAGQCILESGSLAHAPGNNCFGIKAYRGCYGQQVLHTTEWFTVAEAIKFRSIDTRLTATLKHPDIPPRPDGRQEYYAMAFFATFATLSDCFKKRAAMWDKGPYAPSAEHYKQSGDLKAYVFAMGPIYATDPKYAQVLYGICQNPALIAAIAAARKGDTA